MHMALLGIGGHATAPPVPGLGSATVHGSLARLIRGNVDRQMCLRLAPSTSSATMVLLGFLIFLNGKNDNAFTFLKVIFAAAVGLEHVLVAEADVLPLEVHALSEDVAVLPPRSSPRRRAQRRAPLEERLDRKNTWSNIPAAATS